MERMPRAERAERVRELLDLVGLPGYQDRAVASLSGGQAQRVSLARSLAPKPRLLLLDEPLSALDRALRERLAADLHHILRRAGTTALYVTHDHDEAFTVADRVAVMMDGRIVQVGTPEELWAAPADAQVAAFLGYRLITEADGSRFGLSPQALHLELGERGEPAADETGETDESGGTGARPGPSLRDADDVRLRGEVVSVGFARGRTTAMVQIPDWGLQRVIAEGIVPLDPGLGVTVRVDAGGIVRL